MPVIIDPDAFYSEAEYAAIVGKKINTVRKDKSRGEGPAFSKLGSETRSSAALTSSRISKRAGCGTALSTRPLGSVSGPRATGPLSHRAPPPLWRPVRNGPGKGIPRVRWRGARGWNSFGRLR